MKNKLKKLLVLSLLVFQGQLAYSADFMTLPYTFVARQLISASKVMANYNALRNGMIDGTNKINVNEVWLSGTKIIDEDGVFTIPALGNITLASGNITVSTGNITSTLGTIQGVTLTDGTAIITGGAGSGFTTIAATTVNTTSLLVSGNVGIGVTPESWYASWSALQVAGLGALYGTTAQSAGNDINLAVNTYRKLDGTVARIIEDEAAKITLINGRIDFNVAGSAAADSAISWTNAMTIANSGDIYSEAWTDYSSTSTVTGWSSFATKKIFYKRIGHIVWVEFILSGTSNSTAINFTLPYTAKNESALQWGSAHSEARDNGVTLTGASRCRISANTNDVDCYSNMSGGAWTASGSKFVIGSFWYEIESI